MPTIYTLGDPELLREALYALASIFNLVEWSDPGSAMNLGGNMLAVALIGLIAVALAGVTTQQVRVDYLFLSLILFGIMFGTETDVNVEDIQTGEAAVVADIPIGIAYVAAAASGAARSLTETTSTALQTPGRETSIFTQGGFMDPLRILLSLRNMSLADLAENTNKSLLEYYKICVGRTMVLNPGKFQLDQFRSVEDPLEYLFNPAYTDNFSVTYYNDANPGGVTQSCYATAPLLATDIANIATGAEDGVEAYLTRTLGPENYNTSYDLNSINDAVGKIFRSGLDGQEFMERLMLRNFYNEGEAWRLAEYGSNQAHYVASVTQALEMQRANNSTEGTIFLQTMLPLMTFFQFLFFSIAPFIALVMIASPFSAPKVVGYYLLFGVWSYMWMPVAAIINHYMEIALQNAMEYSGTGALNTGHTALLGFDDFYNMAATKISIGSTALASTPVIVGAILTGAVFGVANLAGRISQAGNANRTNTSLMSPELGRNAAVVSIGGRGSGVTGAGLSNGGLSGFDSQEQRGAYQDIAFGESATASRRSSESAVSTAKSELAGSVLTSHQSLQQTLEGGSFGSSFSANFGKTLEQSTRDAIKEGFGDAFGDSLSPQSVRSFDSQLGIQGFGLGAKSAAQELLAKGESYSEVQSYLRERSGEISARAVDALAAENKLSTDQSGSLRQAAQDLTSHQQSFNLVKAAQSESAETANALASFASSSLQKATDIAGIGIRKFGLDAPNVVYNSVQNATSDEFANQVKDGGESVFREKRPVGLDRLQAADGGGDYNADVVDRTASQLTYLSRLAANGNPLAAKALVAATSALAGIGNPAAAADSAKSLGGLANVSPNLVAAGYRAVSEDYSGIISDIQNDPARERTASESRRRRANAEFGTPRVSDIRAEQINEAFDADKMQVSGGNSLSGVSPDLVSAHAGAQQTIRDIKAGAATEANRGLADKANKAFLASPGFNELQQERLPALYNADPKAEGTEALAKSFVDQLQGSLIGQYDQDTKPGQIYQSFLDGGFSPKQAALATYGEVGRRIPGASDNFVAGLSVAAGVGIGDSVGKAGKWSPSKLGFARLAGGATGALAFAAGWYGHSEGGRRSAEDAAVELGNELKADFKIANPQGYDAFAEAIDRENTIQGVADVLTRFYAGGDSSATFNEGVSASNKITEEQINNAFQPERRWVPSGSYSGLGGSYQELPANPFLPREEE